MSLEKINERVKKLWPGITLTAKQVELIEKLECEAAMDIPAYDPKKSIAAKGPRPTFGELYGAGDRPFVFVDTVVADSEDFLREPMVYETREQLKVVANQLVNGPKSKRQG